MESNKNSKIIIIEEHNSDSYGNGDLCDIEKKVNKYLAVGYKIINSSVTGGMGYHPCYHFVLILNDHE